MNPKPGPSRRIMIECSEMDLKVIRAALHTIADQDPDVLAAKTVRGTPELDPDEAATNAYMASMISRDLLHYLAEVLRTEFEGN